MSFAQGKKEKEKKTEKKEDSLFSVIRSIVNDLLNVPTPVGTVGEKATIKAPSASANTPGNITKRN